jgi:hypothetical protein
MGNPSYSIAVHAAADVVTEVVAAVLALHHIWGI